MSTSAQIAYTVQTSKTVPDAVQALTEALKSKKFGILSNINVSKTLKEKTGKNMDDYVILDVCSPNDASHALEAHKEVGLVLPCKIVAYRHDGETLVSLYKPTEALKVLGFNDLAPLAQEVEKELTEAVNTAAKS